MGSVVFIGAGPGAADLITVRGARLLAQAEVVLFDALTDPALRDLAPRAELDRRRQARLSGRQHRPGDASMLLLVAWPRASRRRLVVRLKGGDPSVFGRLEEELQALARGRHRLRGGARRHGGAGGRRRTRSAR